MDAETILLAFAALIVAAALYVRQRLGPALREGRTPAPPPGRLMFLLELGVLVFLCLLIPRLLPRPGPGTGGGRDPRGPSREGPPETAPPGLRASADRRTDERGVDG
jgi:hypothetical protein